MIAAAIVAAMELVSMSRFSTCPSSWATTPSSSRSFIRRRIPTVNATEECEGLRPVAKALGDSSGISHNFGMGSPMRWQRFATSGCTRRYTSAFSDGVTGCAL